MRTTLNIDDSLLAKAVELSGISEKSAVLRNHEQTIEASHDEVLHVIERFSLMGKGIGFVDAHLLAACMLTAETQLWTGDKRLANIAHALGGWLR